VLEAIFILANGISKTWAVALDTKSNGAEIFFCN